MLFSAWSREGQNLWKPNAVNRVAKTIYNACARDLTRVASRDSLVRCMVNFNLPSRVKKREDPENEVDARPMKAGS